MPINSKWILTFGILAMSPSLVMAKGPFSLPNPFKSSETSTPQETLSNQEVANRVAAALRDARLVGYDINIEYKDGVATLTGMIQDSAQKAKADQVLRQIPQVQLVDNQLQLINPEADSAVQQTAFQEPTMPVEQAAFEAPSAPIASPIQQVAGERSARGQQASSKVSNQQKANEIARALQASGVSGYDIEISFKDGVAQLDGAIGNAEQYQHISGVVSQVPGVQQVKNQLQIPRVTQTAFQPNLVPGDVPPQQAPNPNMAPPQNPYGPPQGGMPPGMMPPQGGMPPGMVPPAPTHAHPGPGPVSPVYNQPYLPNHAWPTYAAYPNYAAVSYPKQYSASAFPYVGPFYPYPQVPMGWRSSTLEWDDGQWQLKFSPQTERWWWFMNPKNWD